MAVRIKVILVILATSLSFFFISLIIELLYGKTIRETVSKLMNQNLLYNYFM